MGPQKSKRFQFDREPNKRGFHIYLLVCHFMFGRQTMLLSSPPDLAIMRPKGSIAWLDPHMYFIRAC